MKNNIVILILIFLSSCNKSVNQYIDNSGHAQQRHGKWVEKYPVNDGEMVASGKYKNGEKRVYGKPSTIISFIRRIKP